MKKILVTGAGGSAAANFINSLRIAKEKFFIVGIDTNHFHLELADVNKRYLVPPYTDPGYIKSLNRIIEKESIDFVHPQPDPEVLFLSRNREKINAKLFLPSKETVELCQNKMGLIDFYAKNDIPVGESYLINNKRELVHAVKELLKSHDKVWVRAIRGAGSKGSIPVNNTYHAKAWIDYWDRMKGVGYGDFMVSEFLPGKEYAFQSIWKDGNLITSQARERIEYVFGNLTISGQTSSPSVARSIHRDDINKIVTKAIIALDPKATGVFCVDLKENKNGIPCIMEINAGRFFTTSNFFAVAGCNMPYYYVRLAFDEKLPKIKKYNAIAENLYWIRMIDMGYKLVPGKKWKNYQI